jgi:DNA polymerase III epsilon subunit-like protein
MYIGVDGEMTSPDIYNGGKLIQIGLSLTFNNTDYTFSEYINPQIYSWDSKAAEVHGISIEKVSSSKPAEEVDTMASKWLIEMGVDPKRRATAVPVGFNVGGFDMPFIKASLPKTYNLLSRRVLDLNALCFLFDNVKGLSFDQWKQMAKQYAIEQIGYEEQHDAGWDSLMHLKVFEFFRERTLR